MLRRERSGWGDGQPSALWSEILPTTPGFSPSPKPFRPGDKPGDDLGVGSRSEMLRDTHCRDRPEEMGSSNLVESEVKGGEDPPSL